MHEYLIADYTNYNQPGDDTPLRIVNLGGLLDEMQKANEDPKHCFAAYEIRDIASFDYTLPREE